MKVACIILDMSTGYNWAPGSYGYDMVARVRRLKDAAHAAGVPVVHVSSMRRPVLLYVDPAVSMTVASTSGWLSDLQRSNALTVRHILIDSKPPT